LYQLYNIIFTYQNIQQFLRCGDSAVPKTISIVPKLIRQNQIHTEFISKSNLKQTGTEFELTLLNSYRIRTNFTELTPNSYLFTELVPNSYLFTELVSNSNYL